MASATDTEALPPAHLFRDTSCSIFAGLQQHFNQRALSDIAIVCPDGRFVHAHQVVLASCSRKLSAVLATGDATGKELPIQGVDSTALELVLAYFYSGEILLTTRTAVPIYDVSLKLEVPGLASAVEQYIAQSMSPSSCCVFLEGAVQLLLEHTVKQCLAYAKPRFNDIVALASFQSLGSEALRLLLLHVRPTVSDVAMARALARWAVSKPERLTDCEELLRDLSVTAAALLQLLQNPEALQSLSALAAAPPAEQPGGGGGGGGGGPAARPLGAAGPQGQARAPGPPGAQGLSPRAQQVQRQGSGEVRWSAGERVPVHVGGSRGGGPGGPQLRPGGSGGMGGAAMRELGPLGGAPVDLGGPGAPMAGHSPGALRPGGGPLGHPSSVGAGEAGRGYGAGGAHTAPEPGPRGERAGYPGQWQQQQQSGQGPPRSSPMPAGPGHSPLRDPFPGNGGQGPLVSRAGGGAGGGAGAQRGPGMVGDGADAAGGRGGPPGGARGPLGLGGDAAGRAWERPDVGPGPAAGPPGERRGAYPAGGRYVPGKPQDDGRYADGPEGPGSARGQGAARGNHHAQGPGPAARPEASRAYESPRGGSGEDYGPGGAGGGMRGGAPAADSSRSPSDMTAVSLNVLERTGVAMELLPSGSISLTGGPMGQRQAVLQLVHGATSGGQQARAALVPAGLLSVLQIAPPSQQRAPQPQHAPHKPPGGQQPDPPQQHYHHHSNHNHHEGRAQQQQQPPTRPQPPSGSPRRHAPVQLKEEQVEHPLGGGGPVPASGAAPLGGVQRPLGEHRGTPPGAAPAPGLAQGHPAQRSPQDGSLRRMQEPHEGQAGAAGGLGKAIARVPADGPGGPGARAVERQGSGLEGLLGGVGSGAGAGSAQLLLRAGSGNLARQVVDRLGDSPRGMGRCGDGGGGDGGAAARLTDAAPGGAAAPNRSPLRTGTGDPHGLGRASALRALEPGRQQALPAGTAAGAGEAGLSTGLRSFARTSAPPGEMPRPLARAAPPAHEISQPFARTSAPPYALADADGPGLGPEQLRPLVRALTPPGTFLTSLAALDQDASQHGPGPYGGAAAALGLQLGALPGALATGLLSAANAAGPGAAVPGGALALRTGLAAPARDASLLPVGALVPSVQAAAAKKRRVTPGEDDPDHGGEEPPTKKAPRQGGGSKGPLECHVDDCHVDLTSLKEYHQRFRICDFHLKASVVMREGIPQRFCQQCGRFHVLSEFDGMKRSCRARLQRHNARRRKRPDAQSSPLEKKGASSGDPDWSEEGLPRQPKRPNAPPGSARAAGTPPFGHHPHGAGLLLSDPELLVAELRGQAPSPMHGLDGEEGDLEDGEGDDPEFDAVAALQRLRSEPLPREPVRAREEQPGGGPPLGLQPLGRLQQQQRPAWEGALDAGAQVGEEAQRTRQGQLAQGLQLRREVGQGVLDLDGERERRVHGLQGQELAPGADAVSLSDQRQQIQELQQRLLELQQSRQLRQLAEQQQREEVEHREDGAAEGTELEQEPVGGRGGAPEQPQGQEQRRAEDARAGHRAVAGAEVLAGPNPQVPASPAAAGSPRSDRRTSDRSASDKETREAGGPQQGP